MEGKICNPNPGTDSRMTNPYNLLHADGFNELYNETLKEMRGQPYSKVYEATEQKVEKLTGRRKYSSYKSFDNVKRRKK